MHAMHAMHGEAGRTGNPADLQTVGLDAYGVQGNGRLRVGRRDGLLSETLVWLPEKSTESVAPGAYNQYHPLTAPRKGELPPSILSNWPDLHTGSVEKAPGEKPNRLTGPIQFVLKLLEFWRLETNDAVGMLGFDPADADHVAAVLGGREQFRGRDVRDRISHLFWIRNTLWSLFRDLEVENDWLRESHSMLDDRSPLSLLLGGSMEGLLLAREYVDAVAGR